MFEKNLPMVDSHNQDTSSDVYLYHQKTCFTPYGIIRPVAVL